MFTSLGNVTLYDFYRQFVIERLNENMIQWSNTLTLFYVIYHLFRSTLFHSQGETINRIKSHKTQDRDDVSKNNFDDGIRRHK